MRPHRGGRPSSQRLAMNMPEPVQWAQVVCEHLAPSRAQAGGGLTAVLGPFNEPMSHRLAATCKYANGARMIRMTGTTYLVQCPG